MKKRFSLLFVVLVLSFVLSGCYLWRDVETDQVGIQLNKNKIENCVGSGVYSAASWFADLKQVSVNTLTFVVSDPEVATLDNQLVGIEITIQARRKSDCDSVSKMFVNWSALLNDESLTNTITATAREGIKVGTRGFTLTQLLDDRNGLSSAISTQLEEDANKYSTEIINVTVSNIALDPKYAEMLQEKALLTAQIEREQRRQDLIKQTASNDKLEQDQRTTVLAQKLLAEQAQTLVDVEIAGREGKKTAAAYQVYIDNPAAFELERLTRYSTIFGEKSVFYFLPEGTDMTMLFGGGNVIPVIK